MSARSRRSRQARPSGPIAPDRDRTQAEAQASPQRVGLLLLAIAVGTLLAYAPAWHGGLVWDDDAHFTREGLRSLDGLWRIWTDLTATQQYYPVTHSAFWLMYRLWGIDTLGYHLVNIVLHAISAGLVALILLRLRVPGAMLAAALFALHPVHVESVAWMTELKNTLSGVFYLGALLAWLRFDDTRSRRAWGLALALFVAALLSKSVVATLPGALLVLAWWQRGTIRWREDVLPVVPFAILGVSAGLMTAWVERTIIGAQGAEFDLTLIERGLVAGRAAWFYLATLAWPIHLSFNYPRWTVSQAVWWQYLFPLAALAGLGLLWRLRTRTRAPLAAALVFIGTLLPALGFVDVYPFRYSFVADHFQYLASLGPIALAVAGLTALAARRPRAIPQGVLVVFVGLPLAVLTWRHSGHFADAETLYRATLERNPGSWLAHTNLGEIRIHGSSDELHDGIAHLQTALRLKPDSAVAHNNLGYAWQRLDRLDEALGAIDHALGLNPGLAEAHYNRGLVLERLGRLEASAAAYGESLRLHPVQPEALHNLASVLARLGRTDDAVARLQAAITLAPDSAVIRQNLGDTLQRAGRFDEAIPAYRAALARAPASAEIRNNLALSLRRSGRVEEALSELTEAARLLPDSVMVQHHLGSLLVTMDRLEAAIAPYRRALALDDGPGAADRRYELGLILYRLGRLPAAADEFREAVRLRPDFAVARAALARVLAEIRD